MIRHKIIQQIYDVHFIGYFMCQSMRRQCEISYPDIINKISAIKNEIVAGIIRNVSR